MINLFTTAYAEAAPAANAAAQAPSTGALIGSFMPMILIFVVMYAIMIRPQRKKEKALREKISKMKVGDKVVSIGEISSEGTAYPICFSDKGVYTAGHHYVSKYNVDENTMNLLLEEYAEEVFEEGTGKETYFYTINGVTENVENCQKLEMLFEQYEAAEVLNFQRWQK